MQRLTLHPDNPQPRLLRQAVERLRQGALMAYPTDSSYALGCTLDNGDALKRIQKIRQVDKHHHMTLVCSDLSHLSHYAKVDNHHYRMLKQLTPGPYTFILPASSEVPRRVQHPKRKTIGLRVPGTPLVRDLLHALGAPILSSTLIMPGAAWPLNDPDEIATQLKGHADLLLESGPCGLEPSTVIAMTTHTPELIRQGCGDIPGWMNPTNSDLP